MPFSPSFFLLSSLVHPFAVLLGSRLLSLSLSFPGYLMCCDNLTVSQPTRLPSPNRNEERGEEKQTTLPKRGVSMELKTRNALHRSRPRESRRRAITVTSMKEEGKDSLAFQLQLIGREGLDGEREREVEEREGGKREANQWGTRSLSRRRGKLAVSERERNSSYNVRHC